MSSTGMEQEEIQSEYLRSSLLAFFFSIILVAATINWIIMVDDVDYYGGWQTFLSMILIVAVFIVYQIATLRFIKRKKRVGGRISFRYKIIHTIAELSFPTVIMFFMLGRLQMLTFLDSPVILTYFLFIVLSILHLDFRINIFAGILAAILCIGMIYYAFEYVDPGYKSQVPQNAYYTRAVLLVLSGGAAAFVSRELKKRMVAALQSQQEKNQLALLFGQQVSREVSHALLEEKGATQKRDATIMFLDIRNFTSFADTHTAADVIDYQNKFLAPVIDIINMHQGVVFQILGDGLMACFGAPAENVLHADMAFQASITIARQVAQASARQAIPCTKIGIGLHSGEIVTGNIGSEQRKQFSISGSPVIIASRIEQLNKKYGTEILISGEVHQRIAAGHIAISYLGQEPLRGIEKAVDIYAVSLE